MIKIQLKKNQNVFFTSDTHYNHKNICKGVSEWEGNRLGRVREFITLESMNRKIINSINDVVMEDDILFHFGDWSFGGIENIWEFRKQINCKNIYLFFGNHDHHIINNKVLPNVSEHRDFEGIFCDFPNPNIYNDDRDKMWNIEAQDLFTWCGHYGEFELIHPQYKKGEKKYKFQFIGMHYPIASWNNMGRGMIHLHGHNHLSHKKKIHQGKSMDVGVDGNNFKPYSLSQIRDIMNKQPIKNTKLKEDHHLGFKNIFRIFK